MHKVIKVDKNTFMNTQTTNPTLRDCDKFSYCEKKNLEYLIRIPLTHRFNEAKIMYILNPNNLARFHFPNNLLVLVFFFVLERPILSTKYQNFHRT